MLPRHVQSSARAVDLLSPKLFPALAFLGVKSTDYTFWNYFHKVSGRNPLVRHTAAFSERKLSTFRLELPLPGIWVRLRSLCQTLLHSHFSTKLENQ